MMAVLFAVAAFFLQDDGPDPVEQLCNAVCGEHVGWEYRCDEHDVCVCICGTDAPVPVPEGVTIAR